jgi:hypothetical protein
MTSLTAVAPVLLLTDLALLRYAPRRPASNRVNHAVFVAIRAGSMRIETAASVSAAQLRHWEKMVRLRPRRIWLVKRISEHPLPLSAIEIPACATRCTLTRLDRAMPGMQHENRTPD